MRHLAFALAALVAACSPSGGKAEVAATPAVSPFPAGSALVFPETRALELLNQCSRGGPEQVETTWAPSEADIAELESRLIDYLRQQRPETYPAGQIPDLIRHYAGFIIKDRRVIYLDAEIRGPGSLPPGEYPTLPDRPFNSVCDGGPRFFGLEYDVEAKTFSNLLENGPF